MFSRKSKDRTVFTGAKNRNNRGQEPGSRNRDNRGQESLVVWELAVTEILRVTPRNIYLVLVLLLHTGKFCCATGLTNSS